MTGKKRMNKKWVTWTAALLVLTMLLSAVLPVVSGIAYGAVLPGPGTDPEAVREGYDTELWDRLLDSELEYEELPYLVKEFNPTMVSADQSFLNSMSDVEVEALAAYKMEENFKDDMEALENSGALATMEGRIMYETLKAYAKAMGSTGDTISYAVKQTKREDSSAYRQIGNAADMLTNGAKQVMIGYEMASAQKETLEEMRTMYQALYDVSVAQKELGMVTDTDVYQAKSNLLAAENSLMSLENTIESLEVTLLQLTGWSTNKGNRPKILPIPEVDPAVLEEFHLETDVVRAIGNNQTLITKRRTSSDHTTAGIRAKLRAIEQDEQLITIQMEGLYETMYQKSEMYEAACLDYEHARMVMDTAEIQYQNGSIGRIGYMGQKLAWLQARGAKRSANLELLQAIENYNYAADGYLAY